MTVRDLADFIRATDDRSLWIAGHGTRIDAPTGIETVRAPEGIRAFAPDEMTITCGAGTPVCDLLQETAKFGQYVNLPMRRSGSGTVGGALAVGEGDVLRLGRGSVRDVLLQAEFVDGQGTIVRAGGPTVKNVSGFDLCRLLVGSCGRIGILAEVILRTRPLPSATCWYRIDGAGRSDVSEIMRVIHKPSSVLWSGREIHLCLEGYREDLEDARRVLETVLGRGIAESEPPDLSPFPHRWLMSPKEIDDVVAGAGGLCLAEIGTGVVHHARRAPADLIVPAVRDIEQRILDHFDPMDRLNGGSRIWGMKHRRVPQEHK